MRLHIYSVFDPEFVAYGRVVDGYDYTELLDTLEKVSPCPTDAVVYVPGDDTLEELAVKTVLQDNCYGGMPIQIGYCNGTNTKLNCLEFHRNSEINIAATMISSQLSSSFHKDVFSSVFSCSVSITISSFFNSSFNFFISNLIPLI